jgi:IPT/TIG domain
MPRLPHSCVDAPPVGTDPEVTGITPQVVATGAARTIQVRGRDFQPDADVEFNQVAGTTTFVSEFELTATFTPAGPGIVGVSVRNDALGAESNSVPLRVT